MLYPENLGRYSALSEDTGGTIRRGHWNNVALGLQRMNSQMLEAFGKAFPQYIVWLVTGMENSLHHGPCRLMDDYLAVYQKPRIKRLFDA